MKKLFAMVTTELFLMKKKVRHIIDNKNGGTMIEYSVLIGLITAVVIALIVTVGAWVNGQWIALDANLAGNGAPPAP